LSAAGGWPSTTTGCAANAKVETGTNKLNYYALDFDAATQEYAEWSVIMPSDYNAGTVTAVFYWTAASGSGDVVWGLQAMSGGNDDALDIAYGTAQEVTDTLIAAGDVHVTAATSAITIAGTPAAGDFVNFRVYRKAADGADTLAADARLLGVRVTFTRA
jgi:hypothetical protein